MLNSQKCPHCERELPSSYLPIHRQRCLKRPLESEKKHVEEKTQKVSQKESSKKEQSNKKEREEWKTQTFQCYLCGHMQTIKELDDHFKVCPNRETQCTNCGQRFPRNLLPQHQEVCEGPQSASIEDEDEEPGLDQINSQDQSGDEEDDQDVEDEEDEAFQSSVSSVSLGSIERRRAVILTRIDQMCRERSGRREFYQQLIEDLTQLHIQIRRRAREEDENRRGGMTKKQINQIPNKKYKFDRDNKDTCSICYVDFCHNEEIKDIECRHLFHVECISQWLVRNKKCPNCKRQVTAGKPLKQEKKIQSQKSRV